MTHTHHHGTDDSSAQRLLAAFTVTTLFMIAEVAGGLISGSLALLADAGHMLTDAAALLVALMAVHFSHKPASQYRTFGWLRLTTLAAFTNAIALIVITIFITYEACKRFLNPQPVMGGTMLVIAIAGLLANILAFWLLHRGSEEKNLNVRAAMLHVVGDLLGSVGAIIAAVIIIFTGWTPVDPILSILVSCLVLRSAWKLLRESVNELLEGTPLSIDIRKLRRELIYAIPEVRNIHHVHIWTVGEKTIMTVHVQVVPPYDYDGLLGRIHHFLYEQYHIAHATVQIEYQPCASQECWLHKTEHRPDNH